MNDKNSICTTVLIALVVLLICVNMSNRRRTVIIEPRTEFEGYSADTVKQVLDLDMNVELPKDAVPGCRAKFYTQMDRYLASNEPANKQQADNIRKSNLKYANYEPGANSTMQDLQWQYMNPKMILVNNCMRDPDLKRNTPTGLDTDGGRRSNVSSRVLGAINSIPGSYKQDAPNACNTPVLDGMLTAPIGTGVRVQPEDELTRLVNESK